MASVVTIKDGLHTGADPATPTVGIVTAEEARLSNGASFARLGSGLAVRTGVLYHGVPTLLTGTATTSPSMTVAVSPLAIVGQKSATEGVYVPTSTGTVMLDIAAAPGSNSRVDVVYAMQRDAGSATSPDTLTQAELGVITGTAGVSPAKPAIPVGAVEVGTVTVAAGATATTNGTVTIATTCRWTVPLGAPIPVRNQSERDAIAAFDGLVVDRFDLDRTERYDGATWFEPGQASFVRIKATADQSFGAATWTTMSWSQDGPVRGPAAALSASGGGVMVNVAGLYRVSLQLTAALGAGATVMQTRIWAGGSVLANVGATGTAGYFDCSSSADAVIPAGTKITAAAYLAAGVMTIGLDAKYGPTGLTVTKIPG